MAVDKGGSADLSESAWRAVLGDAVFDSTYDGRIPGPGLSALHTSPLVAAVEWLSGRKQSRLDRTRAVVWKAARALADDAESYGGEAHLEAAASRAASEPEVAFTHAANAAMFHVRGSHGVPREAIALATRIAEEQGWADLVTALRWASKAR
jgi:hypothetical protein